MSNCPCFFCRSEKDSRLYDIRDALELGYSVRQAADYAGVGLTTAYRVQRELKISAPARLVRKPPSPKREKALEMLKEGCSYTEVGRTLGVDRTTVRDWFPGYGWTPQQRIEYRTLMRLEKSLT